MKNKYPLKHFLFNILFLAFSTLAFQNSALAQCPTTAFTTQYMCPNATVGDLLANDTGGGIGWFSSSTNGTKLSTSTLIIIGNTYYLDNSNGNCGSRKAVATIALSPPATSNNIQGFCGDASNPPTLNNIEITGNNIQWYLTKNSTIPISGSTVLSDNTNYYATSSSSNGKCESAKTSFHIYVTTVAPPTNANISATQLFCSNINPKISDIPVNNGIEVKWYPSASSTIPFNDTDLLVNGNSYYAAAFQDPCESTQRYKTTVTITPSANAGGDGTAPVCQSDSPINLFTYLTGTPQSGGSWSGGSPGDLTGGDKGTFNPSSKVPGVYNYTYTITGVAPCPNASAIVTVTVSAKPVINPKNPSTCSGNPFVVTPTNGIGGDIVPNGTTYTWTVSANTNVTGQSNSSTPGLTSISQTLNNSTNTSQTVIYTVTPNINGCSGNTFTITVSVNPNPSIGNISPPAICSGIPFTVPTNGSGNIVPSGTTYTWAVPIVTGGMTGGVSGTAASTISGTLSNPTSTSQTATYTVTPSFSGCTGSPFTVTMTVNPTPSTMNLTDKIYCSGVTVPSITFSNLVSNTNYTWTNSNTAIGLGAGGSNNIPAFTATNGTTNPIFGTISVIATANGCSRPAETFKITVNPSPTVTFSPGPQNICSGSNSALITLSSSTTGALFSWSCNPVPQGISGITAPSGNGSTIPQQNLINTTTNPITITYTAHATTSGTAACSGNDATYTITVNPKPIITETFTPTICSGKSFTVSPTNNGLNSIPTGTTYSWSAPTVTGGIIGGVSGNNQTSVFGNLVNSTNSPQTATYTVTPSTNGCIGAPFTVSTTVNPNPSIATINSAICSGNPYSVTPSNGNGNIVPTGTTYTWTVSSNPNISGQSNSSATGITSISQNNLINNTNTSQILTYTVTPSFNGCTGNTFLITLTVNPIPTIASVNSISICSDTTFSYTPLNGNGNIVPTGTLYTWSNPVSNPVGAVTGASAQATPQVNIGGQPLKNITTSDATITYTVTPSASTCSGSTFTVTVTVKPTPNISPLPDQTYCNGVPNSGITFNSSINGATFAWTNSDSSIGLAASGNGNILPFIPINATNNPIVATISVIATANNCQSPARTFSITVNPTPTINFSQSPQSICSGNTSVAVNLTSSTPNVTLSWTCNPPIGITGAATSGSIVIPAQNLINNTNNPITVTYIANITTSDSALCSGPSNNYTITVNPTPKITNTYTTTICSGSSFTITPTNGGTNLIPTGTTYSWNAPTSTGNITGGVGATNQTEISGTLTNSDNSPQTAKYTVTPSLNGCSGNTFSVNINVNPTVNAGIDTSINVCTQGAPVNLLDHMGGNPQHGGTWTPTLPGGDNGIFDPTINTPGVYTYTVNGISPCSNASAKMTVGLKTPPNAGISNSITYCSNDTPKDLYPLLVNADPGGTWSPALNSGTGIFNPAIDHAGVYTYTISNVIGCQDSQSTVTVSIQTAPNPGTDGTANICKNSAPIDLFGYLQGSPNNGGTWSPPLASTTGFFDPAIDSAGDYTYTVQGISPCGPASSKVTVNVNIPANAGSNATVSLCQSDNPANLYNFLGNADSNGTWSPTLASGTGIFDPKVDAPGTYLYTVLGKPGCSDATASVNVSVQKVANAGEDTFLTLCQDSGQINLLAILGGTPDSNGTWNPPLTNNNILDPSTLAPGTYDYIYTVLATSPCTANASAKVTINISTPANPGTDASLNLCQNGDPVNLSDSLGTHDNGGTWNPVLPGDDLGTLDPKTLTPGVYEYIYTVSKAGCPSHGAKITVTILQAPDAGTDSTATICEDGGTVDLFTYLGGTPQSGGTWSPALTSGTGVFDPTIDIAGTYTYIITGTAPCNDSSANILVTVNPVLNITGGTLDTTNICPAEIQQVNISNISGLADGTYTVTYNLSGANTNTDSQEIAFTNGGSQIFLDGNLFMNSGTVTFTITQIAYQSGLCPASNLNIPSVTFEVLPVPSPEIKTDGNTFCDNLKVPTIADLNANIENGVPSNWYDAATGGNKLDDTTQLQDGVTYYAAGISTDGCENPTRVAVTVTFTCEIVIPDGFSPNGDGINDTFTIPQITWKYPNFKIEIFNRYGNVLYKGDKSVPDWDGKATSGVKFGDSEIPTGVYFYILEYNDGIKKPVQGRLYLSR